MGAGPKYWILKLYLDQGCDLSNISEQMPEAISGGIWMIYGGR